MVTTQQQKDFFTQLTQMGLTSEARTMLKEQGIALMQDMGDWGDSQWDDFRDHCRNPGSTQRGNVVTRIPSINITVGSFMKLKVWLRWPSTIRTVTVRSMQR